MTTIFYPNTNRDTVVVPRLMLRPLTDVTRCIEESSAVHLDGELLFSGHDAEISIDAAGVVTARVSSRMGCGPAFEETFRDRIDHWSQEYATFARWYRGYVGMPEDGATVSIVGRWHAPPGMREDQIGSWSPSEWMDFYPILITVDKEDGERVARRYQIAATLHDESEPPRFTRETAGLTLASLSKLSDGVARYHADLIGYPWRLERRPIDGVIWHLLDRDGEVLGSFVAELADLPRTSTPMGWKEAYIWSGYNISRKFRQSWRAVAAAERTNANFNEMPEDTRQ